MRQKRILIACEFSGIVREAFRRAGWDAWSCDLLPTEIPGQHLQCDVAAVIYELWDMLIAHPPCDHLAVSGACWFEFKRQEQREALDFAVGLMNAPIPRIVVENPISVLSTLVRKPDQIIHPWQFGHEEMKQTCLWLKNVPPLLPTCVVPKGASRIQALPPGEDRWMERARTYENIANAMAAQWGQLPILTDRTPANNRIFKVTV